MEILLIAYINFSEVISYFYHPYIFVKHSTREKGFKTNYRISKVKILLFTKQFAFFSNAYNINTSNKFLINLSGILKKYLKPHMIYSFRPRKYIETILLENTNRNYEPLILFTRKVDFFMDIKMIR